ncbi:SocA family protein [Patescibacteria group bacterium]|nr:SocA family protein [Patescibacteria group bacterium]MCG2701831.1 SocA family protein [Candidatus Parcubacteria bacterium]MBU4265238.1 SocA family protein [Patescibacteria group bacterium]MBU4390285.1 SocA family protein [Patescibacteria group bacterium]MBU4396668.1 SocA family protein [Patescibacteria group bacterium]
MSQKIDSKLGALVLYILRNYNNSKLTETKLQKLLYFCDFGFYSQCEKSITGLKYRKNHFGPTIYGLPSVLKKLKDQNLICILEGKNYYGTSQKTFSISNADISPEEQFSDSELLVINQVNEAYQDLTPREISHISHQDFPYLATPEMGGVIDYGLVQYRESSEEDLDLEDSEAKKFFSSDKFYSLMKKINEKLKGDNLKNGSH